MSKDIEDSLIKETPSELLVRMAEHPIPLDEVTNAECRCKPDELGPPMGGCVVHGSHRLAKPMPDWRRFNPRRGDLSMIENPTDRDRLVEVIADHVERGTMSRLFHLGIPATEGTARTVVGLYAMLLGELAMEIREVWGDEAARPVPASPTSLVRDGGHGQA